MLMLFSHWSKETHRRRRKELANLEIRKEVRKLERTKVKMVGRREGKMEGRNLVKRVKKTERTKIGSRERGRRSVREVTARSPRDRAIAVC